MRKWMQGAAGLLVALCCGVSAMGQYTAAEFGLAPGERLLSVNGVPVAPVYTSPVTPVRSAVGAVAQGAMGVVQNVAQGVQSRWVVNRSEAAYRHAQAEANLLASRGRAYYDRTRDGHPMGIAPGARQAGTGYSHSPDRPQHCIFGELPESRVVARACAYSQRDGVWFWSAHYR